MSIMFKPCYMHINRSACAHYMYFPCMHTDIPERKFHDVIFCLSSFVHHFMFINVLFLLPFNIFLFYRSVQKSHTLPQVVMHCRGETYQVRTTTQTDFPQCNDLTTVDPL